MKEKFTISIDGQSLDFDLSEINTNNTVNYNLQKSALVNNQSQENSLQGVKDLDSIIESNYSEISFIKPSVLHNPVFTKTNKKDEDNFIYRNTGLLKRRPVTKPVHENLIDIYSKIDNEKKIQLSKDFCKDLIYPTFKQISENLKTHNRDSKISVNLSEFEVIFQTIHNNTVEFYYSISIKNIFKTPTLSVRAKKDKSSYIFRDKLSQINISLITENQIYQDFISAYREYISNI